MWITLGKGGRQGGVHSASGAGSHWLGCVKVVPRADRVRRWRSGDERGSLGKINDFC